MEASGMAGFFDDWSGGRAIRAATAAAVLASVVSSALGIAAERFAERELALRAAVEASAPALRTSGSAIDYDPTGAVGGHCRREIVVLGPCDQR
jgi:hypothetical protein